MIHYTNVDWKVFSIPSGNKNQTLLESGPLMIFPVINLLLRVISLVAMFDSGRVSGYL